MNEEDVSPSPGSEESPGSFAPSSVDDLDAVLDNYEFIEILGRGGMGAVYKGLQRSMNRLVAIKILPRMEENAGLRFAERFQREARSMAQMSHPNIATVYDFGQTTDGQLFFVMEYVDGTDLHHVIREGRADKDRIFKWIDQICEALFYAHSIGVVHRDIKPANIMLTREDNVKVVDFGLAKLTGDGITDDQSRLTMTDMAMGTPDYVAPEALEDGGVVDHRADIYALGVLLYEMLTGKVPRGIWKPPSEVVEGIDRRFDDVVFKAMDSDPESRFQQAPEMSTQILMIRDWQASPAPEKPNQRRIKLMTGPVQSEPARTDAPGSAAKSGSRQTPAANPSHRRKHPAKKSGVGFFVGSLAAIATALVLLIVVIAMNTRRNGPPPEKHEIARELAMKPGLVRKLSGHEEIVRGVAILPDGKRGLSISWDKTMRLWDLENGTQLRTYGPIRGMITDFAVSSDGKIAVTGNTYPRAHLWDVETGKMLHEFAMPESPTGGIAISPDTRKILIGDDKRTVFLFDRDQPEEPLKTWQPFPKSVNTIAFLPDGMHFVTGTTGPDSESAKLWRIDLDNPVRTFGPHPKGITSLAVDPSGNHLLTAGASGDGRLRLWNIETGEIENTLEDRPVSGVTSVRFVSGHRQVISGGQDQKIFLWDMTTGKTLHEFTSDSLSTNNIAVSPDGRYALSGGGYKVIVGLKPDGDYDLRLWRLPEL